MITVIVEHFYGAVWSTIIVAFRYRFFLRYLVCAGWCGYVE